MNEIKNKRGGTKLHLDLFIFPLFLSNSNMNLRNICRICFQKVNETTENYYLFSDSEVSKEILQKILVCFQIILDPDKSLPCAICQDCIDNLNTAYDFRNKCGTIHERFKHYCESVTLKTTDKQLFDYVVEIKEETDTDMDKEPLKRECYENKFICDVCKKVLKSKTSLCKHIVSMHEKKRHVGKVTGFGCDRLYHCTSCTYSTPRRQTLVNHTRTHSGNRPFSCYCGKSFTQASSLSAHLKVHSDTTYFTCSRCGKQFKHAFSLKTHMHVHSAGDYSCNICSKVLKSKSVLISHMNRHNKVFNYNCEDCGDTFVTSAELCHHRKKHSTEKHYKCLICDYSTSYKKNLIVHIKRHEGNKTHRCSLCEKTFLTSSNLQRHMRAHAPHKPYPCVMCAHRFPYSSSLNKHMLAVHGIHYKWGNDQLCQNRRMKVVI